MIKCFNAKFSLNYSKDSLSGRCRIPSFFLLKFHLKVYSIISFKIFIDKKNSFEVLCIVFPLREEEEEEGEREKEEEGEISNRLGIVIDDCVRLGNKIEWIHGYCEVYFNLSSLTFLSSFPLFITSFSDLYLFFFLLSFLFLYDLKRYFVLYPLKYVQL